MFEQDRTRPSKTVKTLLNKRKKDLIRFSLVFLAGIWEIIRTIFIRVQIFSPNLIHWLSNWTCTKKVEQPRAEGTVFLGSNKTMLDTVWHQQWHINTELTAKIQEWKHFYQMFQLLALFSSHSSSISATCGGETPIRGGKPMFREVKPPWYHWRTGKLQVELGKPMLTRENLKQKRETSAEVKRPRDRGIWATSNWGGKAHVDVGKHNLRRENPQAAEDKPELKWFVSLNLVNAVTWELFNTMQSVGSYSIFQNIIFRINP